MQNTCDPFPQQFKWDATSAVRFQAAFTKSSIVSKMNTFMKEKFDTEDKECSAVALNIVNEIIM